MKFLIVPLVLVISVTRTSGDGDAFDDLTPLSPLKSSKVLRVAYYISKFEADVNTASAYCADVNMKLVAIEDHYEDADINGYLRNTGIRQAWTSGNDIVKNGKFVWSSTNKSFNYSNWHKLGKPFDDRRGCVFTATDLFWGDQTYGWDEDYCYTKHHFICEEQL